MINVQSLTQALIYTFLGGVLLNFMPCVFPILSLKILSLLNNKKRRLLGGIHYTLGILVSFFFLALVTILLRRGGHLVGWGYHMQSSIFVTILIWVLFTVAMNLSGFFEVKQINLVKNHHFLGEFSTGILTALVASPCAVPFMAIAIGYALTQSEITIILTFETLGLGVAFPYLFLALEPNLIKLLPRPGKWTENLKQLLAFLVYGATIWLIFVLSQQIDNKRLAGVLFSLLYLAFAVWCWNFLKTRHIKLLFVILSGFILLKLVLAEQYIEKQYLEKIEFSPEKLSTIIENKQMAFVSVTASWCITCAVNEMLIFNTKEFADMLKKYQISFLEANWTNRDEKITKYMKSLKYSGVPLYVIYARDGSYAILESLITLKYIQNNILKILD